MNQHKITLLLLSVLSLHRLQATTPLPPHLFNCGLFNNVDISKHKIPKINFNAPQFDALRKQSVTFIKNNYRYIGCIIVLTAGIIYWYRILTKNTHPYRLDKCRDSCQDTIDCQHPIQDVYRIPTPSERDINRMRLDARTKRKIHAFKWELNSLLENPFLSAHSHQLNSLRLTTGGQTTIYSKQ